MGICVSRQICLRKAYVFLCKYLGLLRRNKLMNEVDLTFIRKMIFTQASIRCLPSILFNIRKGYHGKHVIWSFSLHEIFQWFTLIWKLCFHILIVKVSEKAIGYFERAALMQPDEVKWQLMIASCYRRSGNYHRALDTYKVRTRIQIISQFIIVNVNAIKIDGKFLSWLLSLLNFSMYIAVFLKTLNVWSFWWRSAMTLD